jgi:hypothetical protein
MVKLYNSKGLLELCGLFKNISGCTNLLFKSNLSVDENEICSGVIVLRTDLCVSSSFLKKTMK